MSVEWLAAIKAMAEARSAKASAENERARTLDDKPRARELAYGHSWALHNQADGMWEIYHAARRNFEPKDANDD